MSARVMGLDLSLTSTGVAAPDHDPTIIPASSLPKHSSALTVIARVADIRDVIVHSVSETQTDVVVMEDYGGHSGSSFWMGELGGVVRLWFYEHAIPFAIVGTGQLKQFATGSGKANKTAMVSAATHRSGQMFSSDDAADAYWLREIGVAHYEPQSALVLPAKQMAVATKITWPELEVAP